MKAFSVDNIENITYFLDTKNDNLNLYFTKREIEVLRYVIFGYTAKRIGQLLNISFRTVESYIESLKYKLHCNSKGEITFMAIKSGLIRHLNIF